MSITTSQRVREFHEAFGHPVETRPLTSASKELRELRVKLILEELCELADALNVSVVCHHQPNGYANMQVVLASDLPNINVIAAADALADIDYVVCGTALALGIPHDAVVWEVHHANMTKLGADGKPLLRADGKVMRGPNYEPPRVGNVISSLSERVGLYGGDIHSTGTECVGFLDSIEGLVKSMAELEQDAVMTAAMPACGT
jgi:predicted HAD superfamily Cof-like phosphohydrolase